MKNGDGGRWLNFTLCMHQHLPCLKELELDYMSKLVRTPDFGGLPCLQKLILHECYSLKEIHQSLGNHSCLVYLSVHDCEKLTRFPSIVRMDKLEILHISECKALVEFPKIEAKMDSLVELCLDDVGIEVLPSSIGEYCTNLISLQLSDCRNLKSIEGNFHALQCLEKLDFGSPRRSYNMDLFHSSGSIKPLSSSSKQLILSHLSRSLRKLNLGWCGLQDREIPTEIEELSNLQELHLRGNYFTRLDFGLSRLTRLKLLGLGRCKNLVELPELPSSLAILNANYCNSLEANIRDKIHTKCKWLSHVSIKGGSKNIINGDRLLATMLRGNAVESGCIFLQLQGLEIPRLFIPPLVRWEKCTIQLPENWYNDFSGILFCTAFDGSPMDYPSPSITLKFKKLEERGWTEMGFSQHYVCGEEKTDDKNATWVGYVSFGLLRNTSWWDPTSAAIQVEMETETETETEMEVSPTGTSKKCISECGYKLVPKTGAAESSYSGQMETTTTSEISLDDHYKSELRIEHDSKSALKCIIQNGLPIYT